MDDDFVEWKCQMGVYGFYCIDRNNKKMTKVKEMTQGDQMGEKQYDRILDEGCPKSIVPSMKRNFDPHASLFQYHSLSHVGPLVNIILAMSLSERYCSRGKILHTKMDGKNSLEVLLVLQNYKT